MQLRLLIENRLEYNGALYDRLLRANKRIFCHSGDESVGVTEADFEIPQNAPFVRFTAYGFDGKCADTRGFFRDELGI